MQIFRLLPPLLIMLVALGVGHAHATAANDGLFSKETGYRIARYRAPTPDTVPGGKRIDIDELDRLAREEKALLIDVMVAEGAGPDPETGQWRLSKPRKTLPGSIWLADVGAGTLSPKLSDYFAQNLKELTGGDRTYPMILFCMADCWMSWNAVQRAAQLGYTRVYWYPEGTDGWRDWDRTFAAAVPVPLKPEHKIALVGGSADAAAAKPSLPTGEKAVTLITHDGQRVDIAKVTFSPGASPDTRTFDLKLLDGPFQDEFLSMRPFRCLPDTKEMWCHLAYPYDVKNVISVEDLQDLEYAVLFLFKPPKGYGIDAWNGLYFKLDLDQNGNLSGNVHETDMNVLAVPPDDGELRPITHGALSEVDPDTHRFAAIEIR